MHLASNPKITGSILIGPARTAERVVDAQLKVLLNQVASSSTECARNCDLGLNVLLH